MFSSMISLVRCWLLIAVIASTKGSVVDEVLGTEFPNTESTDPLNEEHQPDVSKSLVLSHLFPLIFAKNSLYGITRNATFSNKTTITKTSGALNVTNASVEPQTHFDLTSSPTSSVAPSTTEFTTESSASTVNPTEIPHHDAGGGGISPGLIAVYTFGTLAGLIFFIFMVMCVYKKYEENPLAALETDPLLNMKP